MTTQQDVAEWYLKQAFTPTGGSKTQAVPAEGFVAVDAAKVHALLAVAEATRLQAMVDRAMYLDDLVVREAERLAPETVRDAQKMIGELNGRINDAIFGRAAI